MTSASAAIAQAPAWFHDALAHTPTSHHVSALGCDIHYLRWGPDTSDLPGLLFLHAGGAHAQWWSFIAPFFAEDRVVVALDFSGMGDSGRRDSYGSACHMAEIAAVLGDADLGKRPIIIGHSFGGFIAMCYGNQHGRDLTGMIFVDTPLQPETEAGAAAKANPTEAYTKPKPVHPDRESILNRFRLGPAQPCENDFILEHIAQTSITRCDGGWTWKFDVAARGAAHHDEPLANYLANLSCPKALVYGAESTMVTTQVAEYMSKLFAPGEPFICLPQAHHHLFLDQPIAFVVALRAILSGWQR